MAYFYPGERETRDSGFVVSRASDPPRSLYEHCELFATGVDLDHGGVEQNQRGGGGVSLLLPYRFVRVLW